MSLQPQSDLLVQMRDLIHQYFDLEDFHDLCFRLGVNHDDLRGQRLETQIRDLVLRINRQGRLADLLTFCAHLRPHVEWPDLAQPVALDPTSPAYAAPERNPRQIFISHARQDAEFAHRLADDLRHYGWDIWIAPDSIRPGESWVSAINRGLAESAIFLLLLSPDAVNSAWVQRETDAAIGLQHQDEIRFIPLEIQVVTAPPLWRAYQWISFQNNYKDGLEQLLRELQPALMAEVDGLYRQLQTALTDKEWAKGQTTAAQLSVLYPDFRDTNDLLTQARQEAAQAEIQEAKAADLYSRLQTALEAGAWQNALELSRQIDALVPNYRDVTQLSKRARRSQRQNQREAVSERLRRIPTWSWGGGALFGLFVLFLLFRSVGGGNGTLPETAITPLPVVGQAITETATVTLTIDSTLTLTATTIQTSTPTLTPTVTSSPTLTEVPDVATATSTPIPSVTPTIGLTNVPPTSAVLGDTWTRLQDGMVMVYVPPPDEPFVLGSGVDAPAQEYWIDKYTVTNAQYQLCVDAGVCEPAEFIDDSRFNGDDHPVVGISWFDATAYVAWLNEALSTEAQWIYALPTEGEWEYAAVGDSGALYAWGSDWISCGYANFVYCHHSTVEVDSYPIGTSWVGAMNMTGNVWEWTSSWQSNEDTERRVSRGGSWRYHPGDNRVTYRFPWSIYTRRNDLGFRVAVVRRPSSELAMLSFNTQLGDEWVRYQDGMAMVYVPPPYEPFELESGVEAPKTGYWIDKHPVTNAQYQLCVDAGGCEPVESIEDSRFNGDDNPVVGVSWFDADAYSSWVRGDLPTESEWEYAAVGENVTVYPWGNEFDGTRLNFCDINCPFSSRRDVNWDDGYIYTSPVGAYPSGASWVGALDMAGNTWEWTDSWSDASLTQRVVKGGAWGTAQSSTQAANFSTSEPFNRNNSFGFRVIIRDPSP